MLLDVVAFVGSHGQLLVTGHAVVCLAPKVQAEYMHILGVVQCYDRFTITLRQEKTVWSTEKNSGSSIIQIN